VLSCALFVSGIPNTVFSCKKFVAGHIYYTLHGSDCQKQSVGVKHSVGAYVLVTPVALNVDIKKYLV
jgi:hypothetical protein